MLPLPPMLPHDITILTEEMGRHMQHLGRRGSGRCPLSQQYPLVVSARDVPE